MNANDYQRAALRTASSTGEPIEIGADVDGRALLHGAIGMATEVGELQDAVKRALFYGRELDTANVLEECGDVLWYLAVALDAVGYTLGEAMGANLRKLRARYPERFTEERATVRDLDAERAAVIGGR
jgi:NTP pyrophosphatase (non-canonical NTP hydrolase)